MIIKKRDIEEEKKVALQRISVLVENTSLMRRELLSSMLDPRRNLNEECGYPETIDSVSYKRIYDREGLGTRIVQLFPQETWSMDPMVYDSEDADETEFDLAIKDLEKRLNLWHLLARADEVSGIGRFGVILIGLNDGKELSEPVEGIDLLTGEFKGTTQKRKVLFLRCFDESVVRIDQREQNIQSPRFQQPTIYDVQFQDNEGVSTGQTTAQITTFVNRKVHWTRIIHVADNRLLSEVYGTPRMQAVFNRIYDAQKVQGGAAEMFWKGGFPGYSFEVNPGLTDVEMDNEALREELANYSNGLQRYLALTGVSAKSLAPQVADPTAHMQSIVDYICITLGVPKRIFTGSERGELASSQDLRAWNTRLKRRQDKYLTPLLIRPFIDRLIAIGALPQPRSMEDGYTVWWPDLNTLTDDEKITVASKKVEALARYIGGAVDQIIPPEQFLSLIMGMEPEEIEAIIQAAEEYAADIDEQQEEVPTEEIPPAEEDPAAEDEDEDEEETDETEEEEPPVDEEE